VKLSVGLTEDQTTFVIFGSLIFATLLQPLYGALSDRIGRKPLLIFFGVAGTLATVPILTTLKETKSPFVAFLLICAAWIFVAGYTSINAIVKAELFPTNVPRARRRPALCDHGIGVRRHCARGRALFQEPRA
jgi:MHS family alpha-ketoglutarate permease-like MFS transporter